MISKLRRAANKIVLTIGLVISVQPCLQSQDEVRSSPTINQAMIDRVVGEIEAIIPNQYADGSEENKLVLQIASACLEGKIQRAMKLMGDLQDRDPNLPPQNLILAAISFATNNPLQGRNLLERVAADYREHPGVSLAFGRLALIQGRYFEALTLVVQAYELAQNGDFDEEVRKYYLVESLNTMTVIEMRRNDLDRAAGHAKKWGQLAPGDDEMLLATAEISFQLSKFDSAVELLNQRASVTKENLPSELVMAKWSRAKSNYKLLEKWIEQAVKKHPGNPLVQLESAAWQLRNRNFDEVAKLVRNFEAQKGPSLDSYSLKGRVAFALQQFDRAVEHFGKIYEQQPNNFENSSLYIFALVESEATANHQQAMNIAQRNFQAFPNSQLAALAMSAALGKAGRTELADQLLERAARMGNLLPDTAYFMALKLKRQNRLIQAKIMLDSVMGTKDMFLYRDRAEELMADEQSSDQPLPKPAQIK